MHNNDVADDLSTVFMVASLGLLSVAVIDRYYRCKETNHSFLDGVVPTKESFKHSLRPFALVKHSLKTNSSARKG